MKLVTLPNYASTKRWAQHQKSRPKSKRKPTQRVLTVTTDIRSKQPHEKESKNNKKNNNKKKTKNKGVHLCLHFESIMKSHVVRIKHVVRNETTR